MMRLRREASSRSSWVRFDMNTERVWLEVRATSRFDGHRATTNTAPGRITQIDR